MKNSKAHALIARKLHSDTFSQRKLSFYKVKTPCAIAGTKIWQGIDRPDSELRLCAIMRRSGSRMYPHPGEPQAFTASPLPGWIRTGKCALALALAMTAVHVDAKEKDGVQYGMGLIVNLPFPESDVAQVVQQVVQNGMIRGTKEYNKDDYISGAAEASSTRAFPEWTEGGKVFYKVRMKALDPRNFKDSSDMGTLAVRYVVQPQGDKNTVLRINAVFVEEFRHVFHPSNGSVESAEYKDIHDQLDALDAMRAQTAEAQREKQERAAKAQKPMALEEAPAYSSSQPPTSAAPSAESPIAAQQPGYSSASSTPQALTPQTLEEHVRDLRRQVQRLVKSPGAPLKSAPFHTASTLQSLPTGTEVLIVISTPYWVGVETHNGQRGWILRDQLELVP